MRLFGAGIIVGLFMLLIAATLFVVFAIALKLTGLEGLADASPMHPWGVVDFSRPVFWFILGYLVLSLVLLIFLTAKFALFHAATVAERKMVTLNALGLSSGNVGKLFAGLMAMILPLLIVACLLFHHLHRQFVLSPRPAGARYAAPAPRPACRHGGAGDFRHPAAGRRIFVVGL
ncbi:MAG: hypothetical protein WDN06_01550 [Asticcacaulis sp.]